MLALRPLVWLAFAFGSGLLAGRLLPIRGWTLWLLWLLAAAAAGWCLARARGKNRRPAERPNAMPLSAAGEAPWLDLQSREWLLFCLGCLAFLAGWARQVETTAERERLSALIPDFFQAEVAITAPPDQPPENLRPAKWVCSGRLLAINGAAAPEMPVRICGEGASRFGGGDILRGWVIREAARPPAYPAAFNLARYLESQGYIAALRFTRPAGRGAGDAYAVTPAPRLSGLRLAQEMRRNAIQHILAAFPSPAGAFLAAITFGYRPPPHTAEGLAELQDNFRRAGIAHVMAISGMNVALVAGMVWWLLSLVISDRRFIAFAAIATCFLYLLLSGMEVSALRATLMAVIHLGGYIIGRRGDLVNSLAAAALLIAAYNPGALFDIGFQLSFTAVLFLALLGETWAPAADLAEAAWHSGNLLRAIGHRLWRYLAALFAMSAAATIGCTPLVAYHFLQFSLIGLLANIAVVPLSTLVLAAGLLAPATACPFLPGRDLFTSLLVAPTSLLIRIADLFSHLPGASVATAPLPGWTLALYYAGFAAFFLRKARLPAVWQGRLRSLALTAIAASVLAMCYCGSARQCQGKSKLWLVPTARGEAVLALTAAGDLLWFAIAPRLTEAERVAAGLGLAGKIRLIDLQATPGVNLGLCQAQSVHAAEGKVVGLVVRCGEVAAAVWLASASVHPWQRFCAQANSLSAQVLVSHDARLRAENVRAIAAPIKFVSGAAARATAICAARRADWGTIRLEAADNGWTAAAYDGQKWRPLPWACAATRNPLAQRSASGP